MKHLFGSLLVLAIASRLFGQQPIQPAGNFPNPSAPSPQNFDGTNCQQLNSVSRVGTPSSDDEEEASELAETLLQNEDKTRTASEMADLLYHAMVLLNLKDVKMEEVLEVLRKRFSQSGIEEKSSRKRSTNQS